MRALAELLGDLAAAPHRAARMARLTAYFSARPDDPGWAAAWLIGALAPPRQTPAKLRTLAEARVDPDLFRLSAAQIGDIGETAALIWPGAGDLSVATVAAGDAALPDLLDRLDAEPRVALLRLHARRKPKGARPAEVHQALALAHGADPALIAGAMIEEAPPYPRMIAWLTAGGPAPNWAPPRPPDLPRLDAPPATPFAAWSLPEGAPAAVEAGRAFGADGAELRLKTDAPDGWGFAHDGALIRPQDTPPLTEAEAARADGATLLVRFESGDWAVWPPDARSVICPVTFIETARTVHITLGVVVEGDIAPLIKLPAPDAAKVAAFARTAVVDKFGPVRQVGPGLWAEVSYQGLRPAPRRKIGVTLDGARITRLIWRDGPDTPDLSDIL